ncbi:AAA family ATPase [Streptomonospora nanhaiensis]|uniref:AAA family ATPase n=1 Tax=Streptomonospora nanhaiensis TaxID=1323731 RepID=UPI001C998598|nr:AAA family ATPase [Streptomonospora nanhaiensis]MBX9390752.1 AAA family ATPase [Streptomonospora nanhaiensis]
MAVVALLGLITPGTLDGNAAPFPLNVLEQIAFNTLVVLLFVLVLMHFVAHGGRRRARRGAREDTAGDRPYPGLDAFQENEAAVYFGREEETAQVVHRLLRPAAEPAERFVAVVGASGSGKSSLIRAGVLPRVRAGRWTVPPPVVPGDDPFAALASSLAPALGEAPDPVARRLRGGAEEFAATLARYRRASGPWAGRVLLVVDQLEETVTRGRERDREYFLECVAEALRRDRKLHVLAALRAEFLSDMRRADRTGLFAQPVLLTELQRARLFDVVKRPADAAGFRFAPGLVDRIVADTRRGDAVPLLVHLLRELHSRARERDYADLRDYAALGGVGGAAVRQADLAAARLREAVGTRDVLRTLLLFAGDTAGGAGAADGADARTVAARSLDRRQRRVVDAFVSARLLVSDSGGGEATVRVAHDALVHAWAPLRQEIAAHRERRRVRAELEHRRAEWERGGRGLDRLLTGERLRLAQEWLPRLREAGEATPELAAFVGASQRRDEEIRRRMAEGIRRFAERAAESRADSPVLLPLAALSGFPLRPAERRALVTVLALHHARFALGRRGEAVRSLAWSPDGRLIATATRDGAARVWDAETGALKRALGEEGGAASRVLWTPDPARLIVASQDGALRLWNVETGEPTPLRAEAAGVVHRAPWTPRGDRLAEVPRRRGLHLGGPPAAGRLPTRLRDTPTTPEEWRNRLMVRGAQHRRPRHPAATTPHHRAAAPPFLARAPEGGGVAVPV